MGEAATRHQLGYTVRFTPEELRALQAHRRQTYPAHGLSFNAWVVETLLNRVTREQ